MSSTQKLENHSENGYKVYIPNDCISINGVRTRHSYTGYNIVPPLGVNLTSDIAKTIYADINGDNSNRVQGILDGTSVKFVFNDPQWSALNFSRVRDVNGNLIYNLRDYVNQLAQKLTQKFTGTITNHIVNTSYTHDDTTITLTANDGFKITSASIHFQPYVGASYSNVSDFTINADGKTATATIPNDYLNDSSIKLELDGETESTKPYTLSDVGLLSHDENATLSVTENTATLTAVNGYKITSAKITSKNPYDFSGNTRQDHTFTISPDGSNATITLVPSKDLDYYLKVTTEEKPTEKPYTLSDVGLLSHDENATLSVTENTATLTAVNGYKITSAKITSKNPYDFSGNTRQDHTFTISPDGSNATITLVPSKDLDYYLKVTTEEKPSKPQPQPQPQPQPSEPEKPQPQTKKFTGEVVLNNDVKDKIKFVFDNQITVKISVTDNKYNINSLYYLYQPYPGSGLEKSSNGFTINADKKTATLVIPDDLLDVFRLRIGGDIADTTPLKPETTTAKTQRVYMVDDKGLSELTKQAENYYKGGTNTNYDFTEFINQLYYLPFTVDENLSDPTNKIDTGLWSLNASAREMKDNVLNIDLGTINVLPENNNGFDYNIESIKLYLPLVLPIQIDFQDCYKKPISINYKINLLTGNATINVLSNDKLISTFNQNVQTNLQMFSIYNNKDFGSLNNSINNSLLTPYIKINYYKPVENLVSYETLEHNNLSSYTNFVKTRNASVSCGTQQEQQEIENLLNGGIYINEFKRN